MLHRVGLTLAAIALAVAGLLPLTCAAQARLSHESSGLGLRQQTGLTFSSGWGSSLEAAYAPEFPLAPRYYSLAGELRTALGDHQALSVGIKYRLYDADLGAPGDAAAPANGYALTSSHQAGTSYAPGYQVQFGYQYSAFTLFGLAVGRDMEAYASAFDPTAPYPRQLTFTGQHWLTPSWALSYDVLSGDLGSPSPLRLQGLGLRLGMRYRF